MSDHTPFVPGSKYEQGHYKPTLEGLRIDGDDDTHWMYSWTHVLIDYLEQDLEDTLDRERALSERVGRLEGRIAELERHVL